MIYTFTSIIMRKGNYKALKVYHALLIVMWVILILPCITSSTTNPITKQDSSSETRIIETTSTSTIRPWPSDKFLRTVITNSKTKAKHINNPIHNNHNNKDNLRSHKHKRTQTQTEDDINRRIQDRVPKYKLKERIHNKYNNSHTVLLNGDDDDNINITSRQNDNATLREYQPQNQNQSQYQDSKFRANRKDLSTFELPNSYDPHPWKNYNGFQNWSLGIADKGYSLPLEIPETRFPIPHDLYPHESQPATHKLPDETDIVIKDYRDPNKGEHTNTKWIHKASHESTENDDDSTLITKWIIKNPIKGNDKRNHWNWSNNVTEKPIHGTWTHNENEQGPSKWSQYPKDPIKLDLDQKLPPWIYNQKDSQKYDTMNMDLLDQRPPQWMQNQKDSNQNGPMKLEPPQWMQNQKDSNKNGPIKLEPPQWMQNQKNPFEKNVPIGSNRIGTTTSTTTNPKETFNHDDHRPQIFPMSQNYGIGFQFKISPPAPSRNSTKKHKTNIQRVTTTPRSIFTPTATMDSSSSTVFSDRFGLPWETAGPSIHAVITSKPILTSTIRNRMTTSMISVLPTIETKPDRYGIAWDNRDGFSATGITIRPMGASGIPPQDYFTPTSTPTPTTTIPSRNIMTITTTTRRPAMIIKNQPTTTRPLRPANQQKHNNERHRYPTFETVTTTSRPISFSPTSSSSQSYFTPSPTPTSTDETFTFSFTPQRNPNRPLSSAGDIRPQRIRPRPTNEIKVPQRPPQHHPQLQPSTSHKTDKEQEQKPMTNIWYKPVINHYVAAAASSSLISSTMTPTIIRHPNPTSTPTIAQTSTTTAPIPQQRKNETQFPVTFKVWSYKDSSLNLISENTIPAWALQDFQIEDGSIININQIPESIQSLVVSAISKINHDENDPTNFYKYPGEESSNPIDVKVSDHSHSQVKVAMANNLYADKKKHDKIFVNYVLMDKLDFLGQTKETKTFTPLQQHGDLITASYDDDIPIPEGFMDIFMKNHQYHSTSTGAPFPTKENQNVKAETDAKDAWGKLHNLLLAVNDIQLPAHVPLILPTTSDVQKGHSFQLRPTVTTKSSTTHLHHQNYNKYQNQQDSFPPTKTTDDTKFLADLAATIIMISYLQNKTKSTSITNPPSLVIPPLTHFNEKNSENDNKSNSTLSMSFTPNIELNSALQKLFQKMLQLKQNSSEQNDHVGQLIKNYETMIFAPGAEPNPTSMTVTTTTKISFANATPKRRRKRKKKDRTKISSNKKKGSKNKSLLLIKGVVKKGAKKKMVKEVIKKKIKKKVAAAATIGALSSLVHILKKPKEYWFDLKFDLDIYDIMKKKFLYILAIKYMPVIFVMVVGLVPLGIMIIPLLWKIYWIKKKPKYIRVPVPVPKPYPVPVYQQQGWPSSIPAAPSTPEEYFQTENEYHYTPIDPDRRQIKTEVYKNQNHENSINDHIRLYTVPGPLLQGDFYGYWDAGSGDGNSDDDKFNHQKNDDNSAPNLKPQEVSKAYQLGFDLASKLNSMTSQQNKDILKILLENKSKKAKKLLKIWKTLRKANSTPVASDRRGEYRLDYIHHYNKYHQPRKKEIFKVS